MKYTILIVLLFFSENLFSANPISVYKDWTLFITEVDKKKLCYIESLPIKKDGTYKKRGEPYIVIMREKGAVYDEVVLSSGFLYNEEKDVEISILKRKFPLFTENEKAWTYDRNDDVEIVKMMKLGAKMYISGYSKANFVANDTYSLIGFNDAYSKMLELCK